MRDANAQLQALDYLEREEKATEIVRAARVRPLTDDEARELCAAAGLDWNAVTWRPRIVTRDLLDDGIGPPF